MLKYLNTAAFDGAEKYAIQVKQVFKSNVMKCHDATTVTEGSPAVCVFFFIITALTSKSKNRHEILTKVNVKTMTVIRVIKSIENLST
jgi:hypothetical protein